MADKIDLTGKRFVRLKVLEYSHSKKYKHCTKVYWRCICDCGNECVVCSDRLRSGKTKSCGYLGVSLHKETGKWRAFVTVDGKTIHLGEFVNIEEAIDARKKGELKYYGEIIA